MSDVVEMHFITLNILELCSQSVRDLIKYCCLEEYQGNLGGMMYGNIFCPVASRGSRCCGSAKYHKT